MRGDVIMRLGDVSFMCLVTEKRGLPPTGGAACKLQQFGIPCQLP
jgi:hypothetical protein